MQDLCDLLKEIYACQHCAEELPLGARPILIARRSARILIVGQAPGTRVHASGIPWDDPSGDRLRRWMQVDSNTFYNHPAIAIVPMGFCYPGKGASGDAAPRPECAPLWQERLLNCMPHIKLTILAGSYSQASFLGKRRKKNLTQTVRAFREYLPKYFVAPHPSPRNTYWLQCNAWFEIEALPQLQLLLHALLE